VPEPFQGLVINSPMMRKIIAWTCDPDVDPERTRAVEDRIRTGRSAGGFRDQRGRRAARPAAQKKF